MEQILNFLLYEYALTMTYDCLINQCNHKYEVLFYNGNLSKAFQVRKNRAASHALCRSHFIKVAL